MNNFPQILIVSAGNPMMRDDGLGLMALQELQKLINYENVHFFDSATDIFKLMTLQKNYDKIIILDAIQAGSEPGTIYRLNLNEIENINTNKSVHQIKITEALKLLKIIQNNFSKTEIIFYGIEPSNISLGEGISPIVQKSIKYLVELVSTELEDARSYNCQKYN